MKVDVSKFRGKIVEKFGTIDNFADSAGCSRAYISKYLNHKTFLNQKTIIEWSGLLDIPVGDINDFFLTVEVDETQRGQ